MGYYRRRVPRMRSDEVGVERGRSGQVGHIRLSVQRSWLRGQPGTSFSITVYPWLFIVFDTGLKRLIRIVAEAL